MSDNINRSNSVLVPMGSFDEFGGWVLDTQFVVNMGAPYLLAHGLGKPVAPAKTQVVFPEAGTYHSFVYTYNWVAPWKPEYSPGIFKVIVGETELGSEFGAHSSNWDWEQGADIEINDVNQQVELHDLTGFEGRCGYIFFTKEDGAVPPTGASELLAFYEKMVTEGEIQEEVYDFVVTGAGISGMCAALAASRSGMKTALIQDRPVIGGNNSSEVRVWLGGDTNYEPYVGIGNIVCEFEPKKAAHYGSENTADLYENDIRMEILNDEENLTYTLNSIMIACTTEDGKIESVKVWDWKQDVIRTIRGNYFADCTGDGTLGHLAGADYEVSISGHQGMTNIWYIEETEKETEFPSCPWAIDLKYVMDLPGRGDTKDVYYFQGKNSLGCWFWESGSEFHPIEYAERARDLNFRSMYGAWDAIHNVDGDYAKYQLGECAYIGGKRESRRLMGDLVLNQSDILNQRSYKDGCVPTTWDLDVHYPDKRFYKAFHEGEAFLSKDYRITNDARYWVPYRCLYSRNVENLFMAGRDVSVTHEALGSVRVMRTGGMMGEVIGYAAAMCKEHTLNPRAIYEEHLDEFLDKLKALPNKCRPKVSDEYVPEER